MQSISHANRTVPQIDIVRSPDVTDRCASGHLPRHLHQPDLRVLVDRSNRRFCTTGQNIGRVEAAAKRFEDVLETCWAAKEESHITFVHLNGGFQGGHGLEFAAPFVRAIKEARGCSSVCS